MQDFTKGSLLFFPLVFSLFSGIPEFQFRENFLLQYLRVFRIIDCLIRPLLIVITWFDRLIWLLDSLIPKINIPSIGNIKNSIDCEHHKILSITNTKIPSIAKLQNSIDREDQRVPSIANTKNSVDCVYKNFCRPREIQKSRLHFSYEKQIWICSYLLK